MCARLSPEGSKAFRLLHAVTISIDLFRTAAFRAALVGAGCFVAATLLLFAFIYWQATAYETARSDAFMRHEAAAIAREPPADIAGDVTRRFAPDLHRITFAAVFAPDGTPKAGDLAAPPDMAADGMVHPVRVDRRLDSGAITPADARAVALRLADGRLLLVGRGTADLDDLHGQIERALEIGLIPGILLALAAGTIASLRALARVRVVNRTIARIMQGDLRERLPSAGTNDAFDQLAGKVNQMLDEIERLLAEVKGVGDNIAHDLRTPLARLRSRLEGGRLRARSQAELEAVIDRAIEDLDQSFAIITALLRIGELEAGRRRAGFGEVSLCAIVREAAELYAPLAEERGLLLQAPACDDRTVHGDSVQGDRDLLFEAVANLVDNAVKFAPAGGRVRLSVEPSAEGPAIRVADTGSGIALTEREAVLKRFYRADPSRHVAGSGLGLSLVAAILRLHGFTLRMQDLADGFSVDVVCNQSKKDVLF
jgi:signal transduction histidine kinase